MVFHPHLSQVIDTPRKLLIRIRVLIRKGKAPHSPARGSLESSRWGKVRELKRKLEFRSKQQHREGAYHSY